jgi:beta-galactosidase GanA
VYQTYIPWNLHQPRNEPVYNFEGRLDVVRFVKLAQEVGLFVIIRGPPYICAGFSLSLSLFHHHSSEIYNIEELSHYTTDFNLNKIESKTHIFSSQ